jgi:hypothetical protein
VKNPFLKFYTSDWRSDPRLKMCSMAARGLWVEMICLMHEASPYGHLLIAGQSPTEAQLAVLVGASPDEITALLGELESAGVFSRTRTRVIYSRKLTRMEKKAATARNNGRKGGNPTLGKKRDNSTSDNPEDKGGDKPQIPESRVQREKEEPKGSSKKKGSRLPENWTLPKSWGAWAMSEEGFSEFEVRREAEKFRDWWYSAPGQKGVKLDWQATWRNWIRKAAEDRPTKTPGAKAGGDRDAKIAEWKKIAARHADE